MVSFIVAAICRLCCVLMSTPPDPIPAQQTGAVADESPAEAENKT